jgi:Fe-S cluster biogenesis protein NfuA
MPEEQEIRAIPLAAEDRPTIEKVLSTVRPIIVADGGVLELVEAEGDTVVLRLGGKCMGCIQQGETLGGIRRLLMHALGKAVRVIPERVS